MIQLPGDVGDEDAVVDVHDYLCWYHGDVIGDARLFGDGLTSVIQPPGIPRPTVHTFSHLQNATVSLL